MMKTLFYALSLAFILIFSMVSTLIGAGIMVYDLYTGGNEFLHGFTVFSLSAVLFLVAITSYIVTKTLTNTEILADVMTKFITNEMAKNTQGNTNPLQQLLGNIFPPGMNAGTVSLSSIDEDGKITPLGERQFNSPEEFIKHRNEILAKAFGQKSDEKNFENMSIAELEQEEMKAIDNQEFELAAAIRDLREERKKGQA